MTVEQAVGTALAQMVSEASLMPAQAKGMRDKVGLGLGDAARPCAPLLYNCCLSSRVALARSRRLMMTYWSTVPARVGGAVMGLVGLGVGMHSKAKVKSAPELGVPKPKLTGSLVSSAATANGSMPQAVQRGALIPATAWPAMGVLRECPTGSMLQKSSGASAVTL